MAGQPRRAREGTTCWIVAKVKANQYEDLLPFARSDSEIKRRYRRNQVVVCAIAWPM